MTTLNNLKLITSVRIPPTLTAHSKFTVTDKSLVLEG